MWLAHTQVQPGDLLEHSKCHLRGSLRQAGYSICCPIKPKKLLNDLKCCKIQLLDWELYRQGVRGQSGGVLSQAQVGVPPRQWHLEVSSLLPTPLCSAWLSVASSLPCRVAPVCDQTRVRDAVLGLCAVCSLLRC